MEIAARGFENSLGQFPKFFLGLRKKNLGINLGSFEN